MKFKPAIIESPFKSKEDSSEAEHRIYLNRLIKHLTLEGYTTYASHKHLVDSFDGSKPEERKLGMHAGLDMSRVLVGAGAKPFFGIDYDWSGGMKDAQDLYESLDINYEVIKIGKNPE